MEDAQARQYREMESILRHMARRDSRYLSLWLQWALVRPNLAFRNEVVMLNHGIPVIVVSRILGHSRPSITLDIYGHLIHDMQVEAAWIMDDAITPLEVSFERKGTGIAPIRDEDSLEIQPLEEGGRGDIGSK